MSRWGYGQGTQLWLPPVIHMYENMLSLIQHLLIKLLLCADTLVGTGNTLRGKMEIIVLFNTPHKWAGQRQIRWATYHNLVHSTDSKRSSRVIIIGLSHHQSRHAVACDLVMTLNQELEQEGFPGAQY